MGKVETVLRDLWVRVERAVVVVDPGSDAPGRTVMVPDMLEFDEVTLRGTRALTADELHRVVVNQYHGVIECGWTDADGIVHVRGGK